MIIAADLTVSKINRDQRL